jgi:hypothetical protein
VETDLEDIQEELEMLEELPEMKMWKFHQISAWM